MAAKFWTFLGILIALVSLSVTVILWQQNQITDLGKTVDILKEDKESLREKNKILESKIEIIMREREGPALTFPEDDATLLGKAVRLKWQPTQKRVSMPVYLLNYFRLNPPNYSTKLVIDPSEKPEWTIFFRSSSEHPESSEKPGIANLYGEYLWCVQEGTAGGTSSCRSFSIFESAWDRIKQTGKLLVGTIEGGLFHYLNSKTHEANGFEVELVHWLVEGLNTSLNPENPEAKSLTIEFIYRPFEELLPELDQGKLDLALSQFTITRDRENTYPHIKFSAAYFINNQVLIRNVRAQKKLSEQKTMLGVIKSSSNQKAAVHLKEKFGYPYEIREYESLGRLINDLLDGSVQFTLVDVVSPVADLARQRADLEQYSNEKEIRQGLEDFYKQQAEQDASQIFEQFGIGVSARGDKKNKLLEEINRLICSEEGSQKIKALVGKYEFGEASLPEQNRKRGGC